MLSLLGHPLTILLLGAAISGVLVPWLTRRWQNHQKSLEIKTDLVSELSKAIMQFVMAIQFAHLRSVSQTQADFDAAYRDWEVQHSVLHTKLEAYYPNSEIPERWAGIAERLTDLYALEGASSNENRTAGELALWKKLDGGDILPGNHPGWLQLKNAILEKKAAIIRDILKEPISVLK